jgi:23S rRNA (guanosine2251-2'-O)-methyltransferase
MNGHRTLGGGEVCGRRAVRELLSAHRRSVHEVWLAESAGDAAILSEIRDLAFGAGDRGREVNRARLESEARSEASQGVLAFAAPIEEEGLDALVSPSSDGSRPFLLLLDGVTDPQNLGALLRTAECSGVTGVVLPRHRASLLAPTATKAAAGAIEYLRFSVAGGIPTALRDLSRRDVWNVGLDPGADALLWGLDLATEAVALVLGAEGRGLSRLTRERCDVLVSIPTKGALGSLNVAAAAALACFEVSRRRSTTH